jgi:hypothetical protein
MMDLYSSLAILVCHWDIAMAGICIGLTYLFMMFKEEKTEKSHFISMKVSFTEMVQQYFRKV